MSKCIQQISIALTSRTALVSHLDLFPLLVVSICNVSLCWRIEILSCHESITIAGADRTEVRRVTVFGQDEL